MSAGIKALLAGMVVILVGLILAGVVVTQASTNPTGIGSFSGATSIKDLIPTLFYIAVLGFGVVLVGVGGAGAAGFGPLAKKG